MRDAAVELLGERNRTQQQQPRQVVAVKRTGGVRGVKGDTGTSSKDDSENGRGNGSWAAGGSWNGRGSLFEGERT